MCVSPAHVCERTVSVGVTGPPRSTHVYVCACCQTGKEEDMCVGHVLAWRCMVCGCCRLSGAGRIVSIRLEPTARLRVCVCAKMCAVAAHQPSEGMAGVTGQQQVVAIASFPPYACLATRGCVPVGACPYQCCLSVTVFGRCCVAAAMAGCSR